MRLLLREQVKGLGAPGEVVEVLNGYGRNYLIPQRLAVPNTPENRRLVEAERITWIQREAKRKELAEVAAGALKNALLQVYMRAQPDGTLYGSVSRAVVAKVIADQIKVDVEERWINLASPLKKIGDYDVSISLPTEEEVAFKLTVLPEEEEPS
ncbi:MAG: 50S ribosomal protein L9 [Planctomycetes bacterium]|nr:50S ribosomal protein L9 [Planctomycetota bacterium]